MSKILVTDSQQIIHVFSLYCISIVWGPCQHAEMESDFKFIDQTTDKRNMYLIDWQ